MIDFFTPARAKLKSRHDVSEATAVVPIKELEFEILVPIFGDMRYLKNVDFLKAYGSRVILCTTTKESPEFERAIHETADEHGFRIFRSDVVKASSQEKPNPWRLFSRTLHEGSKPFTPLADLARDEIIRDSFVAVTAPVCIFLDGDTTAKRPLRELVNEFTARDFDISSVRVLASKTNTLSERMQAIEYEIAMDARRIYPWLTSGACMVARTQAIRDIMSHHSLFFSGGDIEIGKLARMLKMHVGHVRFELFTDVPETFRAWFKQRIAWCGGGFRHAIVNVFRFTWRHPFFFAYNTIIVYALAPVRWYEALHNPWIILLVAVIYWTMMLLTRWRQRAWYFVLFPLYALTQVMVIVPIGSIAYLRMAWRSRNPGIIRLRGKSEPPWKNRFLRSSAEAPIPMEQLRARSRV